MNYELEQNNIIRGLKKVSMRKGKSKQKRKKNRIKQNYWKGN